MTEPIRGKVARVLNEREIAINIGSTHGVTVGMYFDVRDPKGEDITDPDTNEVLGSLERPKVRLQVTHIQERLSVASTYRSKRVNIGGTASPYLLGPFSKSLMPPNWVRKYETLEGKYKKLDEGDSLVQTGDLVVQVIEVAEAE